ncbi:hypothetical protein SCLARK_001117 [Spiroplasma clarkii]|uniref:Uncharacterized protein n=1 Tax=Spiroplasma clarkii TaxID=2139 RepID=A0A1Y0L102_9MOLU|nr:hypothetical protein [Spiroplasma clarkii]ARU91683.1 hypothetical protein SCLARK_001117 [Spiroplasma clarkii]ATX71072.1 hypothetical protein SCLAR_v1c07570 [Spiroplasma clarkii]
MIKILSILAALFIAAPFFIWACMSFYSKSKKVRISNYWKIILGLIFTGLTLALVMIVIMIFVI